MKACPGSGRPGGAERSLEPSVALNPFHSMIIGFCRYWLRHKHTKRSGNLMIPYSSGCQVETYACKFRPNATKSPLLSDIVHILQDTHASPSQQQHGGHSGEWMEGCKEAPAICSIHREKSKAPLTYFWMSHKLGELYTLSPALLVWGKAILPRCLTVWQTWWDRVHCCSFSSGFSALIDLSWWVRWAQWLLRSHHFL